MRPLLLIFWLCRIIITVRSDCSDLDKYVVIKHQASGLAVDTRDEPLITIQNYTNSDDQQWRLQPSKSIGLFNIIAKRNGKVLDAVGSGDDINATIATLYDTPTQQWFINSEGTIMNGGLFNHALDIYHGTIETGNYLIVWNRYDDDLYSNEKFSLSYDVNF